MSEWFPPGTSYLDTGGGLPDGPWPQDSPESQHVSQGILGRVKGIQHGVCLRNGVEIYTWGDANRQLDWASCNRTWMNLLWGIRITEHGWEWLDRDASDLPCDAASDTPNPAPLKTVLSYTSLPPVGNVWRYSCGDWWPWQAAALSDLYGCLDIGVVWDVKIKPYLGGSSFHAGIAVDGTLRVKGSCRDWARLGGLLLNGGVGVRDVRIASADYLQRSQAGGPNGDNHPNPLEGYQTHLAKDGKAWEMDLPGIAFAAMARDGSADPDRGHGVVFVEPSKDLIVCARGADPAQYLPTISSACA